MVRLVRVVELVQNVQIVQVVQVVQMVKMVSLQAYRVPEGQGVGVQGPRRSRDRPTGSQGSEG